MPNSGIRSPVISDLPVITFVKESDADQVKAPTAISRSPFPDKPLIQETQIPGYPKCFCEMLGEWKRSRRVLRHFPPVPSKLVTRMHCAQAM